MNDVPHVVVIYAPAAAGKTTNAEALAKMFGCTSIVDDWDRCSPLPVGALALTNVPAASVKITRNRWMRRFWHWLWAAPANEQGVTTTC